MALVASGLTYWPPPPPSATFASGPGVQAFLLDADLEKVAFVVQAPKTGNIRKFYFRTGTITTGGTVDCRAESVSTTTGDPSGSLFGTNTNAACVVANGDDNVWKDSGAFTADAAVTIGQDIAFVVVVAAGFNGNINGLEATSGPQSLTQYIDHFTTAYAKQTRGVLLVVEYDDGSIAPIMGAHGWVPSTVSTFNSGSTPDEIGNKVSIPFPCRVKGVWGVLDLDGLCDVKLYDGDSSVLITEAIGSDVDIRRDANAKYFERTFATPQTLTAGQAIRVTFLPGSVTNTAVYEGIYPSATALSGDIGVAYTKCSRTDAGSWTDSATDRFVFLGLILDQLSNGEGSGGGMIRHPGMTGGLNG